MKRLTLLVTISAVLLGMSWASALAAPLTVDPNACVHPVTWTVAAHSIGKTISVRGVVVGAKYLHAKNGRTTMTFLDLGHAWPDPHRFTIVVWNQDESGLLGRNICVTGLVKSYKGEPEMSVDRPSAIKTR